MGMVRGSRSPTKFRRQKLLGPLLRGAAKSEPSVVLTSPVVVDVHAPKAPASQAGAWLGLEE